jgi:MFS family permease
VVPADPIGLGRHGFVIAGGSVLALGAIALMISDRSTEPPRTRRLGSIEAGSILVAFAVVEAGFVASQVAAIVGGADYVRSSTGLTYAEYARSGFFQLLAAAALALAVLWIVDHLTRQVAPSSRRRVARFGLGVVVLTISIVAISMHRLALYEQEFGLTMLRLFTTVFAAWLAVVFVVAAVHLVRRRGSLLMSIAVSAFIGLLAMNAANPEAVVARRNLHRFGGTEQLDVAYLVNNLGPDAAAVLYDHPTTRAVLCSRPAPDADPWLTLNVGRRRAAAAHTRTCP